MSDVEAWPTEDAATKAVDAAAKASYDEAVKLRASHLPSGADELKPWEDLHPMVQLEFRRAVLGPVWAALKALPDPRHVAWAQGYLRADNGGDFDENPYPSGL